MREIQICLEKLFTKYATQVIFLTFNNEIKITWLNKSYKLGTYKILYKLIHELQKEAEFELNQTSLKIKNIKSIDKFLVKLKKIK